MNNSFYINLSAAVSLQLFGQKTRFYKCFLNYQVNFIRASWIALVLFQRIEQVIVWISNRRMQAKGSDTESMKM